MSKVSRFILTYCDASLRLDVSHPDMREAIRLKGFDVGYVRYVALTLGILA